MNLFQFDLFNNINSFFTAHVAASMVPPYGDGFYWVGPISSNPDNNEDGFFFNDAGGILSDLTPQDLQVSQLERYGGIGSVLVERGTPGFQIGEPSTMMNGESMHAASSTEASRKRPGGRPSARWKLTHLHVFRFPFFRNFISIMSSFSLKTRCRVSRIIYRI